MALEILGSDVGALLLFVLLIAAFVVAFKVMQMVFETILVAGLSAGFYLSLVHFFQYTFSLDRLLLFAFLGATLYMAYSFLASAYSVASTVLEVPYHVVKPLFQFLAGSTKKLYGYTAAVYSYLKNRENERPVKDAGEETSEGQGGDEETEDVKEVVLDKVRDDED